MSGRKLYRLEFELEGLPKSANQLLRKSRFVVGSNANSWKARVRNAVRTKLPDAPLKRVRLTLIRFNYRTLDYDGLVASFKPVVDGLCRENAKGRFKEHVIFPGVLIHDGWSVTGKWEVDQRPAPKGESFIRVIVDEIA